jgi:hypothetical protein
MTVTTRLVTFAASAVQFPAASFFGLVCRVLAEPLRSNTHVSYVGTSAVTNDASGTGVIKEIAQPPAATLPCDNFDHPDQDGYNTIDPTQLYGHGTSGEKLKVTYFQR